MSGYVTLTTRSKFQVGGTRRRVVLGKAPYRFACTAGNLVKVTLTKPGFRLLREHHRLDVIISAGEARRAVILRR